MWIDLSEWVKTCKIFVSQVKAYRKVTSAEKELNDQVDNMTCSVDTSQSLFSAISFPMP